MAHQRLRSVVVEGFTSIRSATLKLHDLHVLVGANGAGKSNFIRALGMLGRIVDGELGLIVGLDGGATALLRANPAVPRLIHLEVESNEGWYAVNLAPAAGDAFIFDAEVIRSRDTGMVTPLGRGHRETALAPSMARHVPVAESLIETMHGCRVFHFHDTSRNAPVKQYGYVTYRSVRMAGTWQRSCCAYVKPIISHTSV